MRLIKKTKSITFCLVNLVVESNKNVIPIKYLKAVASVKDMVPDNM